MEIIEIMSEKSNLPLKVNRKFWDEFLINTTLHSIRDIK